MKAILNVRALRTVGAVAAGLLAFATQHARAATYPTGTAPVVQKVKPGSSAKKASSFAPHPTSQRVFGAPIQSPILGKVTPQKPPPK
jgi:hypothetical protein